MMKRNIAAPMVLAAAFCGSGAIAGENQLPGAPNNHPMKDGSRMQREVEHAQAVEEMMEEKRRTNEIVEEARTRMGEPVRSAPPAEEEKWWKPRDDWWDPPYKFYAGFATEQTKLHMAELARPIQAEQRAASPLQYLQPPEYFEEPVHDSDILVLGYRFNRWAALELSYRPYTTFAFTSAQANVIDPTISAETQQTDGWQFSEMKYGAWEVSILPRWRVHELWSIYGRVGVGYAETELHTTLGSASVVQKTVRCSDEEVRQGTCKRTSYTDHEDPKTWDDIRKQDGGLFPVAGIGVEFTPFFHVEYQHRARIPVAGTTTDMNTVMLYLGF
jgi:opacity protein-like surface antigen